MFDFIYSNETNCVEKISNPGPEMTNLGIPSTVSIKADDIRSELNCAKRDIKDLKTLSYSCLNNELTSTERQKLANTSNNNICYISLDLEDKAHSCFKHLQNELQEM